MAKVSIKAGTTSYIAQVFLQDSSSTTGAGLTGLTNASSGLTGYFHRDTDTTATAISIVTMTVGTFTSGGFKEIDATNMPGWYQFCPPNTALASGAKSVGIHLKGATNLAPLPLEIELTAVDNQDATKFGMTRVVANTDQINGTSQTARDLGASVLLSSGTGTGQLSLSSGAVLLQATQTGVTIPTVTNLTNAPTAGDFTATMKTSIGTAVAASAVASVTGNVGGNVTGSVGSVTGAVASVTGNVGGNVTGSVGSVTAAVATTSNIKKNQALATFGFLITDNSTHAPATGKTVTCTRSIDGGAFATGTLANVAEVSNGMYTVDFGTGDLNGKVIVLRAIAAGCDDTFERIVTQP